jgi:poly-beta-1,6-N-acetyl-D-glucosamine biosynthesis protein PgaD
MAPASKASTTPTAAPSARKERQVHLRRRRSLHDRRRKMPIIDVTKEPLENLSRRWHGRALPYFVWLRVLRPLLLLGFWAAVLAYAWLQVADVLQEPAPLESFRTYGLALAATLAIVLVLLLLRSRRRGRQPASVRRTSVDEVARYAHLPVETLTDWQGSALLSVEHDETGRMRHARKVAPGSTVPGGLDELGPYIAQQRAAAPKRRARLETA